MSTADDYDYVLIREATILVRVRRGAEETNPEVLPEFFDVRTGVQLRQIYPAFQADELQRGYTLPDGHAGAILKGGTPISSGPSIDPSKVVTILEARQRKLDAIVADSIFDQLRILTNVLHEFLDAADHAQKEERFWLAQQVVTLVRKFSGRELAELEGIVEWFKRRPPK
ncbi:MAG: hypothetical protein ACLP5H_21595 [Desulfomonilaceae bacterium]